MRLVDEEISMIGQHGIDELYEAIIPHVSAEVRDKSK